MTVEEKAERLLLERRVTVTVTEAKVKGDHGEYTVVLHNGLWRCNCPARKKCSHIEAVERVT